MSSSTEDIASMRTEIAQLRDLIDTLNGNVAKLALSVGRIAEHIIVVREQQEPRPPISMRTLHQQQMHRQQQQQQLDENVRAAGLLAQAQQWEKLCSPKRGQTIDLETMFNETVTLDVQASPSPPRAASASQY